MPGVDGIAATRAIRARQPEIEVVIFTAVATPSLTRDALAAGASHVFPKTTLGLLVDRVASRAARKR